MPQRAFAISRRIISNLSVESCIRTSCCAENANDRFAVPTTIVRVPVLLYISIISAKCLYVRSLVRKGKPTQTI